MIAWHSQKLSATPFCCLVVTARKHRNSGRPKERINEMVQDMRAPDTAIILVKCMKLINITQLRKYLRQGCQQLALRTARKARVLFSIPGAAEA